MREVLETQRRRLMLGRARTRRVAAALSVLTVASGLVFSGVIVATPVAFADPLAATAYVTDASGTVTVIDTATNTTGATIAVGTLPFSVAVSPDGSTAYVANLGTNTVTVIDTATNTADTEIAGFGQPIAVAVSPDGALAYVANTASGTVTPIDTATNTAGAEIAVGSDPYRVAFTPDGTKAYVTNPGQDTVTPIDTASSAAGTPITVGASPYALAFSPDGTTAYVTSYTGATVTPINVSTNTPGTPISVGANPTGVAFNPDGSKAYVANYGMNTVTVIDVSTNLATAQIPVGEGPMGVAFSPDGTIALVTNNGSDTVTAIDVSTNAVTAEITVGPNPRAVAFVPDQAPVAAFSTSGTLTAGSTVTFDASASTVTYGTIASYVWDFGDGTTGTGVTPTHEYAYGSSYSATVTETSSAGTSTTQVFTGQTMSRNGGPSATITHSVNIAGRAPTAYVINRAASSVTPINTATNTVGAAIGVGQYPFGVAISPDGTKVYVANLGSDTVTVIDVATNTPTATIGVGSNAGPTGVAFSPDGTTAYVSNDGAGTVTAIDVATNTPVATINVGYGPFAVAFTPDGTKAYVINTNIGTVTPINTATNTAGPAITIGSSGPFANSNLLGVAVSPDGTKVYVTDNGSNTVTPIDVSTDTAGAPIIVGYGPYGVAFSPDGTTAYVTITNSNSVVPIDVATSTLGAPIAVGASPTRVAFSPDGATAYVTNHGSNSLTVIDVATGTTRSTIGAGSSPIGVAIVPDQAPVASFTTSGTRLPGSTISFDASTSTVAYGSIANYAWDFGDGTTIVNTAIPTTTHIYSAVGNYTARVTETSSAGTSTARVFTGQTMSRNGGPSATVTQVQGIGPVPVVSGVSPVAGPVSGGNSVTMTGSGFTAATVVKFGVNNATALSVTNDTTLTATAPPGAEGTVDVTVTAPGGDSPTNVDDHYRYAAIPVVSSVSPVVGPLVGGTSVTVTGSGFIAVSSVQFGASSATFAVTNDTTLTATAPPGAEGTVDVTVTTPGGTSLTHVEDEFTYEAAPPIDSDPPVAHVELQMDAGQPVADATVVVRGEALEPFSTVRIELDSASVLLGTDTTDVNGDFEATVQMPSVVSPGTHHLLVHGVRPEGGPFDSSHAFFVDWSGSLGDLQAFGGYTPLVATRILDTRDGQGMTAATALELVVPNALVPFDVTGLVLNVTVTDSQRDGYLTVYPCGSDRPLAAAINFTADVTQANLVDAMYRSGGELCLWSNVDIDVVVDFQGFHSASGDGHLVPRTAERVVDTRPDQALDVGQVLQIPVIGEGRAPTGTSTVALNVAVVEAQGAGYLTVYPCGTDRPLASNLNFVNGQTVSNEVMVQPGADGMVCVYTTQATHLIVDLDATFEAGGASKFSAMVPGRFADSRVASKIPAGQTMEWTVVGDDGAPVGTTALSLNVAVSDPDGAGFLTVYPCDTNIPLASNLNYVDGQTISNHVTASLAADGRLCVFASRTTNVVIDIEGIYSPVSNF